MSIVGPRPHAVAHNERFASLIDGYLSRHRVKPGHHRLGADPRAARRGRDAGADAGAGALRPSLHRELVASARPAHYLAHVAGRLLAPERLLADRPRAWPASPASLEPPLARPHRRLHRRDAPARGGRHHRHRAPGRGPRRADRHLGLLADRRAAAAAGLRPPRGRRPRPDPGQPPVRREPADAGAPGARRTISAAATTATGRPGSRWAPGPTGATGVPILADAAAVFECRLVEAVAASTHSILIGEVGGHAGTRTTRRPWSTTTGPIITSRAQPARRTPSPCSRRALSQASTACLRSRPHW